MVSSWSQHQRVRLKEIVNGRVKESKSQRGLRVKETDFNPEPLSVSLEDYDQEAFLFWFMKLGQTLMTKQEMIEHLQATEIT